MRSSTIVNPRGTQTRDVLGNLIQRAVEVLSSLDKMDSLPGFRDVTKKQMRARIEKLKGM